MTTLFRNKTGIAVTDNIDDSHGTETRNTYAIELVKLANGDLIMVTSERGTADDGIATYRIDNTIGSATYGQVIGTNPSNRGDDDVPAKIDQIGVDSGGRIPGYGEIADMASITLSNGRSFVYTADFEKDSLGLSEVLADGSLVQGAAITDTNALDAVKELSVVTLGGTSFLLSLSGGHSDRLTVWQIDQNDGSLSQVDSAGSASGAGKNFLNNSGHFGAATMMEASNTGFVVTGGEEDGIALWTIDANGNLTLQDARHDDAAGARDQDTKGGSLARDLVAPDHTGLDDLGDAAFLPGRRRTIRCCRRQR